MKHTRKRYTPWIWMMVSLLSLTTLPLHAQQATDQNQRVQLLETLKEADAALASMSTGIPMGIERIQLPPLQVFLDAVTENAAVKRAKS